MITVSLYPRLRKHSGGWIAPDTRRMTAEIVDHKFPEIVAIIGPAGPTTNALKYTTNIGNGVATTFSIVHNLGTKDVIVSLRQNSDDAGFLTDWATPDAATVTLTFANPPATNQYRCTVLG